MFRKQIDLNQKLEQLIKSNSLETVGILELSLLIGGDGDPTPTEIATILDALYNVNPPVFVQIPGLDNNNNVIYLNSAQWTDFQNQIAAFATTRIGYDLLAAMRNEDFQVGISPTEGSLGPGSAEFDHFANQNGGQIKIGSIDLNYHATTASDYYELVATNFATIVHELFHSYVYFKTGIYSRNTPNAELDAYLFEFMACAEMDGVRSLNSNNYFVNSQNLSYVYNLIEHNLSLWQVDNNQPQGAINLYRHSLYQILHGNNLSLENYNTVASLFKTISNIGASILPGAPLSLSNFENSIIYKVWLNSYSQSDSTNYPPLFNDQDPIQSSSGGGGGSGSFDPSFWGWNYNSSTGGYYNTPWFYDWYTGTGGGGGTGGDYYDWGRFWDWINSWEGTDWGFVDGVAQAY